MAYMRKRAAVACNYCRHRKRRCDAKTPVCSLCAESGVPCEYPDAPNDVRATSRPAADADLQPLLSRIAKLEAQVQQQAELMASWNGAGPSTNGGLVAAPSTTMTASPRPLFNNPDIAHHHIPGMDDAQDAHDVSLIIPVGHWTTTGNLMSLPQIKNLLGYYPPNFFLQLESSRANAVHAHVCESPALPTLDAAETDTLVDAFFAYVYPVFPVLDRDMFVPLYQKVLEQGLRAEPASALCLMLFALGKMALLDREGGSDTDSTNSGPPTATDELRGIDYFAPAYRIATAEWGFCYETDHILPLALVHGALYLQYMNLPLQAWRMVHLTSINLQYSVASSRERRPHDDTATTSTRLYWACFIFESDTLAEFHVPRTGIELVVDKLQFPSLSISSGRDALQFLAVCSIRRLLNRIHSTLYSTVLSTTATDAAAPSPASPSSPASQQTASAPLYLPRVAEVRFDSVCTELIRQLKTWYASLPDEIRPDLNIHAPCDLRDGWLRLRYWSAMHIIGRPSVIYVAMTPPSSETIPAHVLEYCKICLDSSRSIIVVSSHILSQRTPYTWLLIHALLAHTLIVCLAALTPALQPLVPDAAELLGQVAAAVKPWASPDSSAEMIAWFVQVVRQKLRLSAINRG